MNSKPVYTREEILAAAEKIEECCLPPTQVIDVLEGRLNLDED